VILSFYFAVQRDVLSQGDDPCRDPWLTDNLFDPALIRQIDGHRVTAQAGGSTLKCSASLALQVQFLRRNSWRAERQFTP